MAKKSTKRAKKGQSRKKRKKGGSKAGSPLKYLIILICIAVLGFFLYQRFNIGRPGRQVTGQRRARARRNITLFVAHDEGLKALSRSIKIGDLKSEIRETFTILSWADSGVAIPHGTKLLGVEIKGTNAILNFTRAIKVNHPGGSSAEMQTIYSIVNSIVLNYPRIKRVKIIIEGKTQKTLAGHIDISVPLGPYRGLIEDSQGANHGQKKI